MGDPIEPWSRKYYAGNIMFRSDFLHCAYFSPSVMWPETMVYMTVYIHFWKFNCGNLAVAFLWALKYPKTNWIFFHCPFVLFCSFHVTKHCWKKDNSANTFDLKNNGCSRMLLAFCFETQHCIHNSCKLSLNPIKAEACLPCVKGENCENLDFSKEARKG